MEVETPQTTSTEVHVDLGEDEDGDVSHTLNEDEILGEEPEGEYTVEDEVGGDEEEIETGGESQANGDVVEVNVAPVVSVDIPDVKEPAPAEPEDKVEVVKKVEAQTGAEVKKVEAETQEVVPEKKEVPPPPAAASPAKGPQTTVRGATNSARSRGGAPQRGARGGQGPARGNSTPQNANRGRGGPASVQVFNLALKSC
jgi:hypothetical protein